MSELMARETGHFTLQGLADLMGQNMTLVNAMAKEMGNLSRRFDAMEGSVNEIKKDIVDIKQNSELDEIQQENIRKAISRRVYSLLEVPTKKSERTFEDTITIQKYCALFHRRCYRDTKNAGYLFGHYRATPKKFYDEAMAFIASWYPKNGVQGLKDEADENIRAREAINK